MNLTITSYKQKLVAEKSQKNATENTFSDALAGIELVNTSWFPLSSE